MAVAFTQLRYIQSYDNCIWSVADICVEHEHCINHIGQGAPGFYMDECCTSRPLYSATPRMFWFLSTYLQALVCCAATESEACVYATGYSSISCSMSTPLSPPPPCFEPPSPPLPPCVTLVAWQPEERSLVILQNTSYPLGHSSAEAVPSFLFGASVPARGCEC